MKPLSCGHYFFPSIFDIDIVDTFGIVFKTCHQEFCGWQGILLDSQPGETPHGGCHLPKRSSTGTGERSQSDIEVKSRLQQSLRSVCFLGKEDATDLPASPIVHLTPGSCDSRRP